MIETTAPIIQLAQFDLDMIVLHTMRARKNPFYDDEKAFIVKELRVTQQGDPTKKFSNNDVVNIVQKGMCA